MSIAAKDGAWISETTVSRFDCSKCGTIETTRWPCNDRESSEKISKHMREKHGGRYTSL